MKAFKISSLALSLTLIASILMASNDGTKVNKFNAEEEIEITKEETSDNLNNSYDKANDMVVIEAINNPNSSIPMDTRNSINDVLTYPVFAQDEQRNDVVVVSFTYTEDGYLQVLSINSSDEKLNPYITKKLEKIRLRNGSVTIGKEYNAKFQFKLL